jgi:hypothetical protein
MGETFKSLRVVRGVMPDTLEKNQFICFDFQGKNEIFLKPGKKYAFLMMLDESKPDHRISFANSYFGTYPGGHGIRREAKGNKPMYESKRKEFDSFPKNFKKRTRIAPTIDGYPDVDTYRDYVFFVEGR